MRGVGRTALGASAGTFCSTVVGFGRSIALAAAIGTGLVADSYNIANQVPMQVFALLGGGAFAFVFVPQLIRHAQLSPERSDEFGSFLVYASAGFGVIVVLLLAPLSPLVIRVMGGSSWQEPQASLALHLTYWCIPQIFFYALFAVTSQLMNARGAFTAVAWIPTLSSLIIIASCIPIVIVGSVEANSPSTMASWETTLLGASTLIGSALQSLLLAFLLRKAGFRLRYRFKVRGLGLRTTTRVGLLTLAAAACMQGANLVTAALCTQAGSAARLLGEGGRGYTAFFYAQTLLLVAQSVASAGLANVILQRLSHHYEQRDGDAASKDLNEGVLAIGALLIPVMFVFICLGPLGTEILFARGETDRTAARFIGIVLAVLSIGLVPYALHDLLIRPFYAVNNAAIPLRSSFVVGTLRVVGAMAASLFLPPTQVLLGIALTFALSYIMDLPLKLRSLYTKMSFKVSGNVVRGYCGASLAGIVAAASVALATSSLKTLLGTGWLAQAGIFTGGLIAFFCIYYPLTARTPASLKKLFHWIRA